MKHWVSAAVAAAVIASGCATSGPGYIGPTSGLYAPEPADLSIAANWYQNTILGDVASFHNDANHGTFIVRPRELLFAIDEQGAQRKIIAWKVPVESVTYITAKKHGLGRIVRLQANGVAQSFLFGGSASDGSSKDEFVDRVLALFPRS